MVVDLILGFFRLFWYGVAYMPKKNEIVSGFYTIYYLVLVVMLIVSFVASNFDHFLVLVVIFVIASFMLGIVHYITDILPIIRMRRWFFQIFKDIKLKTENKLPYFLALENISEYVSVYSFRCYCPTRVWQAKKDFLEMHMNVKIFDIQQNPKDKSVIHVFTQNKPLSANIPWENKYISDDDIFNIGMSHFGVVGMDLAQHPHAFIAGETGSGKSNILKCMIHQAIYKGFEVLLIDFKRGVSFAGFDDKVTVYYEYKDVIKVLRDLVVETANRLDAFRAVKVDNLKDYNLAFADGASLNKKIVFIDELAELLKTRDKETAGILSDSIETLTRLSRAVGIHLIMAIQRPDATVVCGQIKNNTPYRACGRFADKEPSRIVLGSDIASTLPNIKGRFIVKDNDMQEVQGFYYPKDTYIPVAKKLRKPKAKLKPLAEIPKEEAPLPKPVTNKVKDAPKRASEFEFDFSKFKK